MLTILTLTFLPLLGIIYLCLNQKHKAMVKDLLKKAFSWFLIRRKKKKLEGGDSRKTQLDRTQADKEQEIKTQIAKDIQEVKSE